MEKKNKEEFVYVCTRCGSTNIQSDLSKDMIAWGGSTRWTCGECGFSSIAFPEIKKSRVEEFRKKLKEMHAINTINEDYSKSKGITNKTVNKIFLVYNLIGIIVAVIFVINVGIY
jgi:hypothetical protein